MAEFVVDFYSEHYGVRCEPIVRCRDCEYADEGEGGGFYCGGPLVQSWDYYNDEPMDVLVEPDGFCKWGVRKVDE